MAWRNKTMVTEFVLLGLSSSWEMQLFLFIFFLLLYAATLFSNILIILATSKNHHLSNSPMFFLLSHLAFLDICLASFATPRALLGFLTQCQVISFQSCMTQIFFLHLFGGSEMLLLVAMAYDRYVAICHPLHYASVMSRHHCIGFVLASWIGGLFHTSVQLGFTLSVPFCGPNQIDNFFCDIPLVIKLTCVDPYPLEVMMVTNSGILSLFSFVALLVSYGLILSTFHSRHLSEGSSKALSTCTSHLLVLILYFGPCIFIYLRPHTHFMFDNVISVFYTTVTPFLNPAIYALKNKEMRAAMGKMVARQLGQVSAQVHVHPTGRFSLWNHKKNRCPRRPVLNSVSLLDIV
ncbi:olfactory receptor 4K3-like [Protobothrops mucrosquamatus]|uniref:olfactory receptor 4K3-like n=1 Tax=Protobothrops mucrosquamatus TaxID=103944 RepID=UPI000775923E|nr:olfactory receptor 4K3-like [Protobothrops mucrosquamatus]